MFDLIFEVKWRSPRSSGGQSIADVTSTVRAMKCGFCQQPIAQPPGALATGIPVGLKASKVSTRPDGGSFIGPQTIVAYFCPEL
jgi:hypothetical protein